MHDATIKIYLYSWERTALRDRLLTAT